MISKVESVAVDTSGDRNPVVGSDENPIIDLRNYKGVELVIHLEHIVVDGILTGVIVRRVPYARVRILIITVVDDDIGCGEHHHYGDDHH